MSFSPVPSLSDSPTKDIRYVRSRHRQADPLDTVIMLLLIRGMDQSFVCEYCSTTNAVYIDPSGGTKQEFVEDCRVCCRPNVIRALLNEYTGRYELSVYLEDRG